MTLSGFRLTMFLRLAVPSAMALMILVSMVLVSMVLVSMVLVGCGAKTGVDVPDASADAGVDADIPCIELLPDAGPIDLPLSTEAQVGQADVLFLIDRTASMQEEIDHIREEIRDQLAPAIEREINDVRIGVATFADFPIEPYGDVEADDVPFRLLLPMSNDISRVQAAVSSIALGNGKDEPESQTEALYQTATGEGLGTFVPPSFGCPSGGFGYPCFRDDAIPVVLLFSDAPFHNGPSGSMPYEDITPIPHSYAQASAELSTRGIVVMGFDSGDGSATDDMTRLARDTNALDASGNPLVFNIGRRGERLNRGVIDAISLFADAVVFDIDAVMFDPDPGDGVDVTEFVEAIIPLSATPMSGVREIDREAGVFRGVISGTSVVFQLRIRNDAVVPGPRAQRFRLEIVFRGDGRTRLDRRIIEIVIPGTDGSGCDDPD